MLANMPHSAGERVATQLFRLTAKENVKSTAGMCVFVAVLLTGLITGKDAFFFFNRGWPRMKKKEKVIE